MRCLIPILCYAYSVFISPLVVIVVFKLVLYLKVNLVKVWVLSLKGVVCDSLGVYPVLCITLHRITGRRITIQTQGILNGLNDDVLLERTIVCVLGVHPPSAHASLNLVLSSVVGR